MRASEFILESQFLGTCVNAFDEDGYCVIPDLYTDTSDFAVHEESAKEITAKEFKQAVGKIDPNLLSRLSRKLVFLHDQDNNIYMIYDTDNDIHYFFKPSNLAEANSSSKKFYHGSYTELTEARQGLLQYLKKQFPTWPDYILYDFLYKQAKSFDNQKELTDWVNNNKQEFGNIHWKLQNIKITFDAFDPESQRRMKERDMGSSNPYQVPNDAERHATQQAMIAKQGVSKEPIIVVKTPQGYELIEGWHRTIQHLKAFPEGYVGPAWVGS